MKKIIVTVGCSCSGKSTYAHKMWQENPQKIVVINRDKIRELLFSYTEETVKDYYKRSDINQLEKQVTKYEDTLINEALCENKTVIVDATHLEAKYIKRFEYWNVPLEIEWFDITLKEALTRNMSRNRKVDEQIIIKQYNKYVGLRKDFILDFSPKTLKNNRNLPPCVIYDIDGTIAKIQDRSPYDWSKVGSDLVISEVVATLDWIGDLSEPNRPTVIICTGRDGICLKDTVKWLIINNVYYDDILIRNESDMRPDWIIKEEMWRKIAEKYYIVGMYDDRLQVVRRARSLGLKVFNVEYNNF
jgi:predicted kinase